MYKTIQSVVCTQNVELLKYRSTITVIYRNLIRNNLYCYLNTVHHLVINKVGFKLRLTQRVTQSMNKPYLYMHLG
jgi:hypothetical protein